MKMNSYKEILEYVNYANIVNEDYNKDSYIWSNIIEDHKRDWAPYKAEINKMLADKPATKKLLNKFTEYLRDEIQFKIKGSTELEKFIVDMESGKYKKEFKNYEGGIPGDISKVSQISTLFKKILDAIK